MSDIPNDQEEAFDRYVDDVEQPWKKPADFEKRRAALRKRREQALPPRPDQT